MNELQVCVSLRLLTHVIDLRNYYRSFNNLWCKKCERKREKKKENNIDQLLLLNEKWNNLHLEENLLFNMFLAMHKNHY